MNDPASQPNEGDRDKTQGLGMPRPVTECGPPAIGGGATEVSTTPRCTFIVPTRNSERTLETCLQSIRGQTIPCELIVVDNFSTDRTPTIAAQLADSVIFAGPERSAQRNVGIAVARGDVIGFCDSDMEVDSSVAEEAVVLIDNGAGGVIVPEYTDGNGFWVGVRRLERSFYCGSDSIEAARIFERALLEEVGGFDESMLPGPEDWDLSNRVRSVARIERTAAKIRHDEGSIRYLEACQKKAYYAEGLRSYHAKYGTAQTLSVLNRQYIRQPWRLLFPHPLLGLGIVALKAGETVAVARALVSNNVGRDGGSRSDQRDVRRSPTITRASESGTDSSSK